MKLKTCLVTFAALAICVFFRPAAAQSTNKTIVLVRHTEKAAATEMDKTGDVDLSPEGRLKKIAAILAMDLAALSRL